MYARDCYKGLKVGRLTLIEPVSWKANDGVIVKGWHCKCDCGNEKDIVTGSIGRTLSCGCFIKEKQQLGKYSGLDKEEGSIYYNLYHAYDRMINSCYDTDDAYFSRFGGNCIKVYYPWRHSYEEFKQWSLSNGYNPEKKMYLVRKKLTDDFSEDTCYWSTTPQVKESNLFTYLGQSKPLEVWAKEYGLSFDLVKKRFNQGLRNIDLFRKEGTPRFFD